MDGGSTQFDDSELEERTCSNLHKFLNNSCESRDTGNSGSVVALSGWGEGHTSGLLWVETRDVADGTIVHSRGA